SQLRKSAAKKPVSRPRLSWWFVAALGFFACGLMSKPMLVTLPFVLLLLDYWPLRRFPLPGAAPGPRFWSLLREKTPFFVLSLASSVVTFVVQRSAGAMPSLERLTLSERLWNAVISYWRYLLKTIWPVDLCIYYPHPGSWPPVWVALAVVGLILVTLLVIRLRRNSPYLLVGWFWFLGTLVPVLGLVQVGSQSMADRYTYIPLIGFFLGVTWGLTDALSFLRKPSALLIPLGAAILVACALLSSIQISYWRNSQTLFSHALAVTRYNLTAELCLGCAL